MISDQILHEQELAFFGKITASISHELNNVLSIINEYTGLLNDLCSTSLNENQLNAERIQKISLNIADQITRQQKLIKLLNRFAHRFDDPLVTFDLNELISDVCLVSSRFASMKKITIEFTPLEEAINITNNPSRIQLTVFSCFQLALEDSDPNDIIKMTIDEEKNICIIKISSRYKDISEDQDKLRELISSLILNVEGKIEYDVNVDQFRTIKISLPVSTDL